LELIEGRYQFSLAGGSHSSANLINLAGTNALVMIPIDVSSIETGTAVKVLVI
jgi:molybdopterin molybdotransferase